jgi:hypothetical protein
MLRVFTVAITLLCAAAALAGPLEEAEEEMRKAKIALDKRDYEEAVGHYLIARSLAPESSGPYLGLGLAYAAMRRCNEAVPALQEYLRRKTRDPHPGAQPALNACRAALEQQHGPPTPPPVSAPGRLIITSDPPGAEVRVDDEEGEAPSRGRTPLEVSVPPGAHAIYVSHPGYRDEARTVTTVSGQRLRVDVTLQPQLPTFRPPPPIGKGDLRVAVKPLEAKITVNGMEVQGQRRSYSASLEPGIYHVVIERPGYETVEHDLIVRPGQSTEDTITLVSTGPRERKRKAGIAIGVIVAAGAVAGAIALGVVYGTPPPETHFATVLNR